MTATPPTRETLRAWHRAGNHAAVLETAAAHPALLNDPAAALVVRLSELVTGRDTKSAIESKLRALLADSQPAERRFPRLPGLTRRPAAETLELRTDRGLAWFLLGEPDQAAAELNAVVADPRASDVAFGRLAATSLALDDLEAAERHYREAAARNPDRVDWHSNLGGVLLRQQRLDEALACYDQALRVSPAFEIARQMRAQTLAEMERGEQLVDEAEERFEAEPDHVTARLDLANALLLNREPQRALQVLQQAACATTQAEAEAMDTTERTAQCRLWARIADLHAQYQQHQRAVEAHRQAAILCPQGRVHHQSLEALHLAELGRQEQAWDLVAEVLQADPQHPGALVAQATLLTQNNQLAEAAEVLGAALAHRPGDLRLIQHLAQIEIWLGRLDSARAHLEAVARRNPLGFAQLIQAQQYPDDEGVVDLLRRLADNLALPAQARSQVQLALARLLDHRGDYTEAFQRLDDFNRLERRQMLDFNAAAFSAEVDAIIRAFPAGAIQRLPDLEPMPGPTPIFVLGMPRSGTSLLEQILASHPLVFGAGELGAIPRLARQLERITRPPRRYPQDVLALSPPQRQALGRQYLRVVSELAGDRPYVVDKLPHNFLHIGFIHAILPQALIVHMERDPRDLALSNYEQNFKSKHGILGYAFDLSHTAAHLNDHHRLMQHWRRVMPGLVYDQSYADLVRAPHLNVQALLAHLGLPWDEAVLAHTRTSRPVRTASAVQVRSDIYSSSLGRWRHYAEQLEPLTQALSPSLRSAWPD